MSLVSVRYKPKRAREKMKGFEKDARARGRHGCASSVGAERFTERILRQGSLPTNAKKVTVSVLYWYEKLSSQSDWNFWNDSEKNQKIFFCLFYYYYCWLPWSAHFKLIFNSFCFCVFDEGVIYTRNNSFNQRSNLNQRPCYLPLRANLILHHWVRPYLVESTTSRPICEVKQLQA